MFDTERQIFFGGGEKYSKIFIIFPSSVMGIDFILTDRSDWNVVFVKGGLVYVNTTQPYCSLTQPIWKVCTSQTSLSQRLLVFYFEPCTFLANQNKPFASKESIHTRLRFVSFLNLLLLVCLLFCVRASYNWQNLDIMMEYTDLH